MRAAALLTSLCVLGTPVGAQNGGVRLDESYGDAFVHYRPYVVPGQQPAASAPAPAAAPAPRPAASEPTGAQKVDVAWLRKYLPVLEERAINDPSPENAAAQMYAQRIALDMSQRYAQARIKAVHDDPLLDENNRVPYASVGAQAIRNANLDAQQRAVRELASQGGLLIFVDGNCRFCAMQMPVVSVVRRQFGMEYLAVSLDGEAPKGFAGRVQKDNGLFRKLNLRLTPSIVFVPKPQGYRDGKDPNTYLVIAQGYYAADELVKQIAYAGHTTKLLSKQTMADLDIWNRGVASSQDLSNLKLDPNNPQSIRQTLQPLLLKQYERTNR